jgi:predicted transcriptional regulator
VLGDKIKGVFTSYPHNLTHTNEIYIDRYLFSVHKDFNTFANEKKIPEVQHCMNTRKTTARINQELDVEWIDLIITAQKMGIPLEDIRLFLKESSLDESSNLKNSWG